MWFYVGYAPDIENQTRTVTFRANQQRATFEQNETDHNLLANVTGQINSDMRVRLSINRQWFRDQPGVPDASSPTARAPRTRRSFPARSSAIRSTTSTSARSTGSSARGSTPTSRSACSTTARAASAPARSCATCSARRTSSTRRFPRRCRTSTPTPTSRRAASTVFDDFLRNTFTADLTYYANKWGYAHAQGRRPVPSGSATSAWAARSFRRSR